MQLIMRSGLALSIALCCLNLNCQAAPQQTARGIERAPALSDADLPSFLTRVQTNFTSNSKLAQQYTSDELWHNRNFDKNGKTTIDESAKFENIFVEGLPYSKKIEANGKPLAGKDAAAEEKRYNEAVNKRRAMTIDQKRMSLHRTWRFSLPICCLATLFSNHIVGFDQIGGREVVVIESLPRTDVHPSTDEDKSALNWKQKSWIDISDAMFSRTEAESLADANHMAKGTTVRMEFDRVIDSPSGPSNPERPVWLQRSTTSQFRMKLLWMNIAGITEQTWSNFKKFHVDMRLLEDTVTPVSENSANPPVPDPSHP